MGSSEGMNANRKILNLSFFIAVLITSLQIDICHAEEGPTEGAVWEGLSNSFALPLDDLFIKKTESEWRNSLDGWSIRLAYNYPLTKSTAQTSNGKGNQGERNTNETLQAGLKYTPISYWFINVNFSYYLEKSLQKSWDPDFTYVFGYDDWHPYTLSLTYSNFGGNRLHPAPGQKHTHFDEGTWSLGWKFPPPEWVEHLLTSGYGDSMGCNTSYNFTPTYTDSKTNKAMSSKGVLSMGCKYNFYSWWYVNFAIFYYPDSSQKQPWNPDYTYGFGYFDWHPGTLSLQYNNYSGNRFSSSERAPGTGGFENGALTLSWSHSW
jgi:hypothetical protein